MANTLVWGNGAYTAIHWCKIGVKRENLWVRTRFITGGAYYGGNICILRNPTRASISERAIPQSMTGGGRISVEGCKKKAGTNYAIQYLTASIVEEGVRFNLLCLSIPSLASVSRKFEALVRGIRKMIPIKLLFLDRGFGNKKLEN